MSRVGVIDYGLCNLDSVARAIAECGGDPIITSAPEDISSCDHLVLPGVGAFSDAMANLTTSGFDHAIKSQVRSGIPLLGVCLGMQLLARYSTEGGNTPGLGLIAADVVRLVPQAEQERIPHIGWNSVDLLAEHPIFQGIPSGSDFYFVHSYHVVPDDPEDAPGTTPYCGGFASVIARDNVIGLQFHPEKSQRWGLRLIANFLALSC